MHILREVQKQILLAIKNSQQPPTLRELLDVGEVRKSADENFEFYHTLHSNLDRETLSHSIDVIIVLEFHVLLKYMYVQLTASRAIALTDWGRVKAEDIENA